MQKETEIQPLSSRVKTRDLFLCSFLNSIAASMGVPFLIRWREVRLTWLRRAEVAPKLGPWC